MKIVLSSVILLSLACFMAQIPVGIIGGSTTAAAMVNTPTYDNDTGSYVATVSVTISDSTGGATIIYCTNIGSDCNPVGGTTYTSAVVITTDLTHLCAYATHAGLTDSATHCANYHIFPSITNLQLLLEADCITVAPCTSPADGTVLSTWADNSGNGRTATVASGTCTFHTNQVNGLPSVTFSSCHANFTAIAWNAGGLGITEFVVLALTDVVNKQELNTGTTASFAYMFSKDPNNNNSAEQLVTNDNSVSRGRGTAAPDTSFHQMNVTYSNVADPVFRLGRAADTTIGGAHGSTGGSTSGIGWDKPAGGNNFPFSGKLAEDIIFDRILNSTEIGQVETYLNNKYGL